MDRRALKILLLIILAGPCWTSAAYADEQAVRYFEDALSRFEAGDLQGALLQARNSLQRDPGHPSAKLLLGRIRLALGHPKAAEEALQQARELGASSSSVALPLARARNQLGKFKLNASRINPVGLPRRVASDLWVELGAARVALGDLVGAEIAYDEALKLVPDSPGGKLGLVAILLEGNEKDSALALCAEVLDTAPGNADAWFMMGTLLESAYQLEAAESHFRQALTLNPSHPKAQLAHAVTVLNRNRPDEAVPLFEAILSKQPWSLEAAYLLSQAEAASGRPDAAEAALQRAAEMVSKVTPQDLGGNPRLLLISSLVLYDANQLENAFAFLKSYLQVRPKDTQARKQLAKILALTGKPLEAIRELRSVAIERPRDAQVHVMLGDVYADMQEYLLAEQYYRAAIELAIPSVKLISRLGFAQHGQGRTDLAIDTMRRLVDFAPGRSAGASIFLGILYVHLGDFTSARRIADDIAARMPENLLAINLQAVIAVAEQRYADGRRLFREVLARDAGFDPARVNLIKLDIVQGRYERAREALDRLLGREPGNLAALRTYAEFFVAQKDYRSATEYLEQIRTLKHDSIPDAIMLSQLYELLGRRADAFAVVAALQKAVPGDVTVKLRLAELNLANGDVDEARSILVDAAQLAGTHGRLRIDVAEMQVRAGAFDDAIQGMQRLLSEDPQAALPRLLLGRIYLRQQRLIIADDMVSDVLRINPLNAQAMTLLGDIRIARGQFDDAVELYRLAIAVEDAGTVQVRLYKALVLTGDTRQAVQGLKAWDAANPGNEQVMGLLADYHLREGERGQAISIYYAILEINPASVSALNNLALAMLPLDSEESLRLALQAKRLAEGDAAVLDTLGWIQVQVGDLPAALSNLREAATRNETVPDIRYHLAVALEEFGHPDAARRELERALGMDIPFDDQDDALVRLRRLDGQQ